MTIPPWSYPPRIQQTSLDGFSQVGWEVELQSRWARPPKRKFESSNLSVFFQDATATAKSGSQFFSPTFDTPRKTNMTIENQPFESMYLRLTMVIFRWHVSFQGCKWGGCFFPWHFETSASTGPEPRPIPMELPFGQARWEVGKEMQGSSNQTKPRWCQICFIF